MFIDDYIEKIALQEELKNVKDQLKAVQDENIKLKTELDWHREANAEKRSILLERNEKIARLIGDIHKLKGEFKILKYSNEEKQHEGDNLRNRIKDLESEIDQLKKTPSAAADVDTEMIAIHTADAETINKLNIRVHDLNITITTLLDRLSKSTDENQELKKKVQKLKNVIEGLEAKLYK